MKTEYQRLEHQLFSSELIFEWQKIQAALPGVYVLYVKPCNNRVIDEPVYIGLSVSIRRRVGEHWGWSKAFRYLQIENSKLREGFEKYLIRRYRPTYNITHNF